MNPINGIPDSSGEWPLFAPFAVPRIGNLAKAWHDIRHLGVKMTCSAGSIIRVEGEFRFDLFYLEVGNVQVIFDTPEGRARSVVSFEAGSIFNLAPAATRREASGQYQCLTKAIIWRIPGNILHDPGFAVKYPNLMLSVIEVLGTLVLTYHTYLTDLLLDNFVIRFSRFLLSLSLERDSRIFPLGMTQEQLATVFGVHRATLARAIQYLKHRGVIASFTCRRVEILDMEGLRSMTNPEKTRTDSN